MDEDNRNWWGTWDLERVITFILVEVKMLLAFMIGFTAGYIFLRLWRM